MRNPRPACGNPPTQVFSYLTARLVGQVSYLTARLVGQVSYLTAQLVGQISYPTARLVGQVSYLTLWRIGNPPYFKYLNQERIALALGADGRFRAMPGKQTGFIR
jgi:hypothetical protein